MTKVLRIFALLMAASMLLWIAGCSGDDDDDDDDGCANNVVPKVTVAPNGGTVSKNSTITLTFSKLVESASATLGGDAVILDGAGKVYTFSPTKGGSGQALTITAEDAHGCAYEVFVGAIFDVPVELLGDGCDPKNGATVDPASITEIVLKFSETLDEGASAVTSILPEDLGTSIDSAFAGDTLTITFLRGYRLGYEETVVVEVDTVSLAGDTAGLIYTFTTMVKQ